MTKISSVSITIVIWLNCCIDNKMLHNLEIDFIINVNKSDINIILSEEHCNYKWVTKDSELLDDYIKSKLENI